METDETAISAVFFACEKISNTMKEIFVIVPV
jgi:hypothetical protein